MNILVLGGGGREHALAWKVAQSPLVEKVFIAPGNAGTAMVGENVTLDLTNHVAIATFAKENNVELVIVGPDDLLAAGIVDSLKAADVRAFGPSKDAAEIEWSKSYAKKLMEEEGIPTARHRVFDSKEGALEYARKQQLPLVIKADGLALGKGVIIAATMEEAEAAIEDLMGKKVHGDAGTTVVIEEYMEGLEISVHALCDGERALMFPSSKDHKRVGEGDRGPNTGGMGTVAPVPLVPEEQMELVRTRIVEPLLAAMKKRGRPFSGLLFPGVMLTKYGPMVIEFNARFGDPETQSYMRLMESDIVPLLMGSAKGSIEGLSASWHTGAVACVVMASGGYPGSYEKGKAISGIENAEAAGAVVFHAGTKQEGGAVVTSGGRVLNVTATGPDLGSALKKAYAAATHIGFEGAQYRRDLGASVLTT